MLENQKFFNYSFFRSVEFPKFYNSSVFREGPVSTSEQRSCKDMKCDTFENCTGSYLHKRLIRGKIPVIFSCVIGGVVEVKGNKIFPFPNWVVKSEFMPQKSYPVAIAYSSSFSLFCLFKYLCIRISLFLNFSLSLSLLSLSISLSLFYSLFVARMYLLLFHAYKQRPKLETRIFFCKIYS